MSFQESDTVFISFINTIAVTDALPNATAFKVKIYVVIRSTEFVDEGAFYFIGRGEGQGVQCLKSTCV